MKLAYVSPLSPARSGIADYSEEILPYLGRHCTIELVVDGDTPANREIAERFAVRRLPEFEQAREAGEYDATLYHLGNHVCHAAAYWTLARYPGITVLHDYVLHHLVVEMTVGRGDPAGYVREMAYSGGPAGVDAACEALRTGQFPYLDYPLNRRVLDASLGIIVHSAYVRSLIRAVSPTSRVAVVPHYVLPPTTFPDRAGARASLGIPEEAVVFGTFGLATPAKRLEVVLPAFVQVHRRFPAARLLVVGEVPRGSDLPALAARLGIAAAVDFTGYVARSDLLRYIAATDVGLSLRWPTMGETSGSLLRLLAAGKPTIVSNVGAFAEIPDDCCQKIPVGEAEAERLTQTMLALAADPAERVALGARARAHVAQHHAIADCAARYVAAIERFLT